MARSADERFKQKQAQLLERTAASLGVEESVAAAYLQVERRQSIRVNPLKATPGVMQQLSLLGWTGEPFDWCMDSYSVITGESVVKQSDAFQTGEIYIQNAASWLPVIALDPRPSELILDVCAAPGGKTAHIAALTNNKALITANDNSRPRLAKLRANLDRLGVENVEYTLYDATQLSRKLDGRLFDKILLDAPCSGEGMMTLHNRKDFDSWSVAHIKRLQQLQKKILVQSWNLLKPGGTLVYSTCTMAPEENEAIIDYLLRHNPDAQTLPMSFKEQLPNRSPVVTTWNDKRYSPQVLESIRLHPSSFIEAFFVCALRKRTDLTQ